MKTSTLKTQLFCLALTFLVFMAKAQIKPTSQILKPILQKQQGNSGSTQQATGTSQAPASSPALTDADYFLSVATVTIKTAQDNKEANSKLYVSVYPAAGTDNYKKGYTMDSYTPELKPWSTNSFTLPKAPGFDKPFNSLAHYKQTGVMVDILYNTMGNGPFFLTDAWKIQEISAVLEFKDANGNPHPTMPSKTIYFNGGDMYLDFAKWHLYCKTDEYFNVLPSFITKRN